MCSWSAAEKAAGRRPGPKAHAEKFGISVGRAWEIFRAVRVKTGVELWCFNRRTGTHGLTFQRRRILLAAWVLWDEGERPTFRSIRSLLEMESPDLTVPCMATVTLTRRECVEKRIWPEKFSRRNEPLSPEQKEWIVSAYRRGVAWRSIPLQFHARFNRRVSGKAVYLVIRRAGIIRCPMARRQAQDIDRQKSAAIAARGGLAPRKLEEPSLAGCRRGVRT